MGLLTAFVPMNQATLVVGRHPVREALKHEPEKLERIYVQQGSRGLHQIRRIARFAGVPVQEIPPQQIRKMAGKLPHQGVVAFRLPYNYYPLEKMLADAGPDLDTVRRKKPFFLALDHIEDPRNFGAIVRTAVSAKVAGVIVPSRRMAPLSSTMIKASAGTATRMPIARVKNLTDTLEALKERGYWILGTSAREGVSMWNTEWNRPFVLVMGAEGRGLSPRLAACCDLLVSIPMPGEIESLNVSVATGILLFTALHHR